MSSKWDRKPATDDVSSELSKPVVDNIKAAIGDQEKKQRTGNKEKVKKPTKVASHVNAMPASPMYDADTYEALLSCIDIAYKKNLRYFRSHGDRVRHAKKQGLDPAGVPKPAIVITIEKARAHVLSHAPARPLPATKATEAEDIDE